MSGKSKKKTKDDLADFFLGNDQTKSVKTNDKTSVLAPVEDNTKSLSVKKATTSEISKKDISSDPSLFSLEAALKQSEYLKVAQSKVNSLEKQIDTLKSENEVLSASAIVLKKKYEEMTAKFESLLEEQRAKITILTEDLEHKSHVIGELEKKNHKIQSSNEEFKLLVDDKLQQVRVKERELQNRLEILQHEGDVVITSKDETILDLKKQMDQMNFELDSYKAQSKDLNQQIQNLKDQIRRGAKALRAALGALEQENIKIEELKKTGT